MSRICICNRPVCDWKICDMYDMMMEGLREDVKRRGLNIVCAELIETSKHYICPLEILEIMEVLRSEYMPPDEQSVH